MGVCENCQLALDELEARTEELEQKRVQLRARKSALQELTERMAEKGEPASTTLAAMMEEENLEAEETEALCSGYRFGAIVNFKCPHNVDHLTHEAERDVAEYRVSGSVHITLILVSETVPLG
ncbi:hypothetical protein PG984_009735 [Apiospora sp. TS-2023a]